MGNTDIQQVVILGSTGSIGINTLDVIRRHKDRYHVLALTANKNVESLYKQCVEFKPIFAVMLEPESAQRLSSSLRDADCQTQV